MGKRKAPHTATRKGKRVLIITKEGQRIIDKFLEGHDSFVLLEKAGKIPTRAIRSMSDYKPYPKRHIAVAGLALLAALGLGACASSDEDAALRAQARRQQEDSFRQPAPKAEKPSSWEKSIPARTVKTEPAPPPPARAPEPVAAPAPPPPPAPKPLPTSNASPYIFVSPWIGKWAYQEDPSFTMELREDGSVAYGQLFSGTFDLIDNGKVLSLKLVGQSGLVQGRQLSPVLFTIEYADGGNMLVLRNGGNMMVMRRTR